MKKKLGAAFLMAATMFTASSSITFAAGDEEIAVKPKVMPEPKEQVQVFDLEEVGLSKETVDRMTSQSNFAIMPMAAGWQFIDSHTIWPDATNGTWNSTNWDYISPAYTAVDGGNIGLVISQLDGVWQNDPKGGYLSPSKARIEVMVYEDDGVYSDDDHITTFNIYPFNGDQYKYFDVSVGGYADGANAKAEIEFRYTWNFTATSVGYGSMYD